MNEILELRLELSTLLGLSNYAEYSVQSKMVESPEEVIRFLENLVDLSMSQAKKELIDLEIFAGSYLNAMGLNVLLRKIEAKNV